jgi:hypothetical protein
MNNVQITDTVNSIEKSHMEQIEDFFLSVYPLSQLVSHGLGHHRRVWEYAKVLLPISAIPDDCIDKKFILNTIIACYFHDIGMAEDTGMRHGELSSKICTEFLAESNLNISEFKVALEAIEYHDDKEYLAHPEDNKVLDILSVADDLDAFGITGIYRYVEIYLKRGISFADIGSVIIKNARSRFENLEKRTGLPGEFIRTQRVRYDYLIDFFREYNRQVKTYNFSSANPSGNCGIIQILSDYDAIEYLNNMEIYSKDHFITNFFIQLNAENEPNRTT